MEQGNHRSAAIDLAALRKSVLLTQVEVATAAGLTESTVVLLEGGKHEARISTVRDLARALNRSPQEVQAACEESRRRAHPEMVNDDAHGPDHNTGDQSARTNFGATDKEDLATGRTVRVVSPEVAS